MAWSKESRHARGYGADWERARKVAIDRDKGLCQACLKAGRVTVAKATKGWGVDHIVCKAAARRMHWTQKQMDDPSNLQVLCGPCHLAKSEAEQGKTLRPKVRIGLDGWPVPDY